MVVVVAGMEGALPSVVGGLVEAPVIAVPTSVGYGASFQGLAALLAMLNSCASGVAVVNIDNGFGAGYLACSILRPGRPAAVPPDGAETGGNFTPSYLDKTVDSSHLVVSPVPAESGQADEAWGRILPCPYPPKFADGLGPLEAMHRLALGGTVRRNRRGSEQQA